MCFVLFFSFGGKISSNSYNCFNWKIPLLTTLYFPLLKMCTAPTKGHKNSELFLDFHALFVHMLRFLYLMILIFIFRKYHFCYSGKIQDGSVGIAVCLVLDSRGLIPNRDKKFFSTAQRPDRLGLTHPHIQLVQGDFSLRMKLQGMKLTTHLHLVPRSRMAELYFTAYSIQTAHSALSTPANNWRFMELNSESWY
jgi:hypothetical protein